MDCDVWVDCLEVLPSSNEAIDQTRHLLQVMKLAQLIAQAKQTAKSISDHTAEQYTGHTLMSLLGLSTYDFNVSAYGGNDLDDLGPDGIRKTDEYLERSLEYLCQTFKVGHCVHRVHKFTLVGCRARGDRALLVFSGHLPMCPVTNNTLNGLFPLIGGRGEEIMAGPSLSSIVIGLSVCCGEYSVDVVDRGTRVFYSNICPLCFFWKLLHSCMKWVGC